MNKYPTLPIPPSLWPGSMADGTDCYFGFGMKKYVWHTTINL